MIIYAALLRDLRYEVKIIELPLQQLEPVKS